MNVILVIFDSLRKDCMGVYGSPPWGKVHTPHFDAFARESLVMTRAFPESFPTLQARRAIYTGQRVYPFAAGPGWGPIPENQPTLAEMLGKAGYRTGLIADLAHMFAPSMNYWRGFDQWTFLRGQETESSRSGPRLTQAEIDYWLPEEIRNDSRLRAGSFVEFIQKCIMNIHQRTKEEDYFAPRVLKEAALWLEQNQDADKYFLTVESFDPHEPWLIPAHYRKMYLKEDGREQVVSWYRDVSSMDRKLLKRTQANYSGAVTLCDRWFGYFMESMRVLNLLDNTMVILTTDHGHAIGDGSFMGKRGYPSTPDIYDIALMIRFPKTQYAGATSNMFVQHHDITAAILEVANIKAPAEIDGISFLENAVAGKSGPRDHVTVGGGHGTVRGRGGAEVTVITDRWWLNGKVDGTGVFLYDLGNAQPFIRNVADDNTDVVNRLFAQAKEDAGGSFPEWLIELARKQTDAPGCSELAARV